MEHDELVDRMQFFSELVTGDLTRTVKDYAPHGMGDSEFDELVESCLKACSALKDYTGNLRKVHSGGIFD